MTPDDALDCLILADDLTGACDAAAPFAATGRRTVVRLAPDAGTCDARVLAVSTDSRGLAPAGIRAAIAGAAAGLAGVGARVVFKKIDSTLRGHPGVEIAAALEAFGCRGAVVCPAFPAMQRVVRQGWLEVASAADFTPVHVATQVSGTHRACGELGEALSAGARIVSLDAVCDADLDCIAEEISALEGPILWGGSAGLAAALARSMSGGDWRAPERGRPGPVIFCIGSDHPATLAQQAALLGGRRTIALDCYAEAGRIRQALAEGEHVLIRIPRDAEAAQALARSLGGTPAAALMVSGGDTASLLLRALAVQSIVLCDEIVRGVPRGILRGGRLDGTNVVTKSGGFGGADALVRIGDYFSCPNR